MTMDPNPYKPLKADPTMSGLGSLAKKLIAIAVVLAGAGSALGYVLLRERKVKSAVIDNRGPARVEEEPVFQRAEINPEFLKPSEEDRPFVIRGPRETSE
jgi:hypothetical protein